MVIVGYDEVGQLIDLMLERANVPHVAVERDIAVVQRVSVLGARSTSATYHPSTQEAAGLGRAAAVFVSSREMEAAQGTPPAPCISFTSQLDVYVRVRTLADQDELIAKGIKHAGTGYIESTLVRGRMLLKDLGVTEEDVSELLSTLRDDDYALIRAAYSEAEGT